MKNLKLILMSIFTTIGVTEITHPIILTGPARRQAHRDEAAALAEEAYISGRQSALHDDALNATEDNNYNDDTNDLNDHDDENVQVQLADATQEVKVQFADVANDYDDVNIQLAGGAEDTDEVHIQFFNDRRNNNTNEYYEDYNTYYEVPNSQYVTIQGLEDNDNYTDYLDHNYDENYADDAVVQIQSFGDGSLLAELSPEKKQKLKDKLMSRLQDHKDGNSDTSNQKLKEKLMSRLQDGSSPVVTQSLYDYDDEAEIQAIEEEKEEEEEEKEEERQVMPEQTAKPTVDHETSVHGAASQPAAVQPAQKIVLTKSPESNLHQAVQASANFAQTTEHEEHQAIAQPILQPTPPSQSIEQPAPAERIKIIKVYPVYDAVMSAFEHIKSATQDMIDYVYNLIAKK